MKRSLRAAGIGMLVWSLASSGGCKSGPAAGSSPDAQTSSHTVTIAPPEPSSTGTAVAPAECLECKTVEEMKQKGYRIDWQSMSRNWTMSFDGSGGATNNLSLTGRLALPADRPITGTYSQVTVTQMTLIGADGKPISDDPYLEEVRAALGGTFDGSRSNNYFRPARDDSSAFSVTANLTWRGRPPIRIGRLVGYAVVLFENESAVEEIKLDGKAGMVELGPGLSVWPEAKPQKSGSQYMYTINFKRRGAGNPSDYRERYKPPMITDITLLDAQGRPLATGSRNMNMRDQQNGYFQVYTQSPGNDPVEAASVKVEAVLSTTEVRVPFCIHDLPLP